MIRFQGVLYDGKNTAKHAATLLVTPTGQLKLIYDEGELEAEFSQIQISDRLANIPRSVAFAGGERFITDDNAQMDKLITTLTGKSSGLVHQLESKSHYVAGALLLLIAAMIFLITVGVPRLAEQAAEIAPPSLLEKISVEALDHFDESFLQPSELPMDVQNWLQNRFAEMTVADEARYGFRLIFRKAGQLGPNAFALPSGDVVVTDELVHLADHEDEVLAVLAHEIGHVVKRHSLRRLFEDSMLAALVFGITGDTSSFAQTAAALPVLLVSSGYSRDFEREADDYALAMMQQQGIEKYRFADILSRIEQTNKTPFQVPGFLSTHPVTDERIQQFVE